MPIYEYECTDCRERREVFQGFYDDPLTTCSSCGGELKKLISNTSFVLKGTGWYITDYSRNNGSKENSDKGSSQNSQHEQKSDKA